MCLGVPGRVAAKSTARSRWSISSASPVRCGWSSSTSRSRPVTTSSTTSGFAIRRIPEADIEGTLAMYEQLLREADDDLMAADVQGELKGTRV